MINKVILIGNLCKDNEVRVLQGTDKKVIKNSIAVKRNFKNSNGEYDSDFINLVVYEPQVNYMEQYIQKGDKVAVSGRWQHRHYTNQSGIEIYVDECIVNEIELLAKPQRSSSTTESKEPKEENPWVENSTLDITPDDLPF